VAWAAHSPTLPLRSDSYARFDGHSGHNPQTRPVRYALYAHVIITRSPWPPWPNQLWLDLFQCTGGILLQCANASQRWSPAGREIAARSKPPPAPQPPPHSRPSAQPAHHPPSSVRSVYAREHRKWDQAGLVTHTKRAGDCCRGVTAHSTLSCEIRTVSGYRTQLIGRSVSTVQPPMAARPPPCL
jgi:hypothetical protein